MLHVADQRRNENEKLAILVGSLFRFRSICVQMFNTIFRITIITAHVKEEPYMSYKFLDICIGDTVLCYDEEQSHDFNKHTLVINDFEDEKEYATKTNPLGRRFFGVDQDYVNENGEFEEGDYEYLTIVNELNFLDIVKKSGKCVKVEWNLDPEDAMIVLETWYPEDAAKDLGISADVYKNMSVSERTECAKKKYADYDELLKLFSLSKTVYVPDDIPEERIPNYLSEIHNIIVSDFEVV
jgi:hypothetical protein